MNQPKPVLSEILSLSDVAFTYNLDPYRDALELYFRQDWTVDKFFAVRKGPCICINSLKFLHVFADGLSLQSLNLIKNPRIVMSFRKRASDNIGFVLVSLDKKGWGDKNG